MESTNPPISAVLIASKSFETAWAIGTIGTIIWKPGFRVRLGLGQEGYKLG